MADEKRIKEVQPKDVQQLLEKENGAYQVIDVREDEELDEGRIPGSVHIPLGTVPDRMNELDPSRTYVTVCRSGKRSARAAEALQDQGFTVRSMAGGMNEWTGKTE
ncbi:rhodanese-like domain-containing protein [Marinococcus sp. PL1-022]|uniref:rhodanese-like domain-containing protein n=1 Tax=Marinococcus sp. PL1-022 TaxID=3095363 RepID=UPI0029C4ACEB|nr:rhodanese-like domain-containing protein [Marinococcus sp. PL1-022]MDX6153132.1 rhodanese-like domain-containing protein [Marinococcus sp. PL1-022]